MHYCPYCGDELVYHDWYGKLIHGEHYWIKSYWKKLGDIYKCPNLKYRNTSWKK